MPRETINITLSEMDPYRSGAHFFAIVAYPDPRDRNERDTFAQTLVRQTLMRRIELHREWAEAPQVVRPGYFSGSDAQHASVLNRGAKNLNRRLAAAQYLVLPHLRAIDTGTKRAERGGLKATVENMSILATDFLGMKSESVKTFQSRYWNPSKPVVHAMCGYIIWHQVLWKKWGRKLDVDKQLAFLILPEYVEEVVQIAEEIRLQVPQIRQFKIPESDTIQLVTTWLPDPAARLKAGEKVM